MKPYKVREIIKLLEDDGWRLVSQKGSHRQFKHQVKKGRVTLPGKPSENVEQWILNSIWKQASWK